MYKGFSGGLIDGDIAIVNGMIAGVGSYSGEKEIDGETTAVHYYESWHVSDGICEKEPGQDSDDLFCIGHPLDDSDALKESIGHRGKVTFKPRVFLIKEGDPLYSDIKSWPTDVVKEANGLRACYYTEEMEQKVKG